MLQMVYRGSETKTSDQTEELVLRATKDGVDDSPNNTEKTSDGSAKNNGKINGHELEKLVVDSPNVQKADNVDGKGVGNTDDDLDDGTNDIQIGYRK